MEAATYNPPPAPELFPHNQRQEPPSNSLENLNPSIFIIVIILSATVIVSVTVCFLLRHLPRCFRRNETFPTTPLPLSDSHRRSHSNRRVSPENDASHASLVDSLPVFTFSSVTRRSSSTTIGGDCAVCLSKFEPQDQLRLLPLCCHAFHVECIDTWLATNESCPICRAGVRVNEADLMKVFGAGSGDNSFRLEIGSISRRQSATDSGPGRRSYSFGSFEYIVDDDSEIIASQTNRRNASEKEESDAERVSEQHLAGEVGMGRNWLKDYVDRLSASISSRTASFRSSGRFFTGSSRRSDFAGVGDIDLEANRIGDEISELFRWFSGV